MYKKHWNSQLGIPSVLENGCFLIYLFVGKYGLIEVEILFWNVPFQKHFCLMLFSNCRSNFFLKTERKKSSSQQLLSLISWTFPRTSISLQEPLLDCSCWGLLCCDVANLSSHLCWIHSLNYSICWCNIRNFATAVFLSSPQIRKTNILWSEWMQPVFASCFTLKWCSWCAAVSSVTDVAVGSFVPCLSI